MTRIINTNAVIESIGATETAPSGAVSIYQSESERDDAWKKAQARRDDHRPPLLYINCYMVDSAYGGPEEGDWWFEHGRPVESRLADTPAQAVTMLKERRAFWDIQNEDRRPITSVLSEGQYRVYRESHFAKPWPAEKPHYE